MQCNSRKKKKLAEYMFHVLELDHKCLFDYVVEIINELSRVIKWSSFHISVNNHLKADEGNIQTSIIPSDDDKISYLEHISGVKVYGGL